MTGCEVATLFQDLKRKGGGGERKRKPNEQGRLPDEA